jgi:hypothetical protein
VLTMPILRHPRAGALERFAEAASHGTAAERADVARHLVRCARCRETVAFRRSLRDGVQRLPVPAPSDDLLARVLADRAQGARAILPVAPPRVRGRALRAFSRSSGGALLAGIAAATAFVLVPQLVGRDVRSDPRDEWFVSGGLFAGVAGAQAAPAPDAPPAQPVDGTRLRPRSLLYETRWSDRPGRTSAPAEVTVLSLDSTRVYGVAAWRVARRMSGERVEAETLLVARDDLRPLARTVRVAPYDRRWRSLAVAQRFAADSVSGAMRAESEDGEVRRSFAARLPRGSGPYVTDALAPLFLAAADLAPAWTRSVSMLGWAVVPGDVSSRVTLRVIGEERVTVPAGTFDCWRMVVSARGRVLDYWVRKEDGVAVRAHDASPPTTREGRRPRDIVLVQEQPR